MVLKHRQKLWQRVLLSWPTIIILIFVTILLTQSLWDIYKKSIESSTKANLAKNELAKLLERKDSLTKDLNRVSNSAGIEAELRDKFDVGKDGERLLVIIDKEIEQQEVKPKESWINTLWQKINNVL